MTLVRWFAGLLAAASAGASSTAQEVPPGPPDQRHHGDAALADHPAIHRASTSRRLREGIPQRSGGRIQVTLRRELAESARPTTAPSSCACCARADRSRRHRRCRRSRATRRCSTSSTLPGCSPRTRWPGARRSDDARDQPRARARRASASSPTYPFPAQVFFCRDPIASLADLKGKRVRTPGGSQNDFVQAIGGAAGRDRLSRRSTRALERGVVDCAVTGTATGNGARWYEVTQAHLRAAGAVGCRRLRRQSRVVEQARRARCATSCRRS